MVVETVIALALMFGALVMFHELGHFVVARLVGIRVEEFAFGFGPKLLRLFKRGDTEYTVHPVPLGGFVKLAGMEPGEEDIPDGFQAQERWKRALVIFSGPLASFALAVVTFVLIGVFWGFPHDWKRMNRAAMVQPQSVASKMGLRAGDRIVKINGKPITDGRQMVSLISRNPGKQIVLAILRNGRQMTKTAVPSWSVQYLGFAWSFMKSDQAEVDTVVDPAAAEKTGIENGDKLISLNGQKIRGGAKMVAAIEKIGANPVTIEVARGREVIRAKARPEIQFVRFMGIKWFFGSGMSVRDVKRGDSGPTPKKGGIQPYDQIVSINTVKIESGRQMVDAIRRSRNGPLTFVVERAGETVRIEVHPTAADYAALQGQVYDARGLLGFVPQPVLVKMGLADSVETGLERFWQLVRLVITSFSLERIQESVGGPVLIAKHTSSMVALGVYYVVQMAGILSLSLAFVNLLPIPVLDGGHLAILGIEAVRKKRLTAQQMQMANLVGLAIIVMLVVTVLWSDIFKLTHGLVPQ